MTHARPLEHACGAIRTSVIVLFVSLLTSAPAAGQPPRLILWYAAPAGNWEREALPIGNGRLGCMIFGGVAKESIQFNEDSLWVGDEKDTGAYQAFGDLHVEMSHQAGQDYRRQLDIGGGTVTARDGKIAFENVDSLTLLLAADTDYLNRRDKGWRGEHPHQRLGRQLAHAASKPYTTLRDEHVHDYQALLNRLSLDVGQTPQPTSALPTNERLKAYKGGGADPDLEELLFQYARYLMISSSRPGSLPANLQGLWNRSNQPPWRCDYHTDVNVQMNYWFVDHANLPECFEPYAEWLHSIRGVRTERTKEAFKARGWTMRAENGAFGGSTWKWVKPTAAWCAQNLWDHYAFTQDKAYLRTRAYPIMKELCEFWEDVLKALPDGTLVSPDGYSPEHGPSGVDGVSHDQQLVWDLFTNTIDASKALGVDKDYADKIALLRERLLGPKVGRWGQLQEWMEDDGSTGWSRAWKICIWARLHDGDRTYKILHEMLQSQIADNLYDLHPPFQIDGNFGYAAGICEMLAQSHMGDIHLLPALPSAWKSGSVKGLVARGAYELSIQWADGKLAKCRITSRKGGKTRLRYRQMTRMLTLQPGESLELDPSLK